MEKHSLTVAVLNKRAEYLRKNATKSEIEFCSILVSKHIEYEFQVIIYPYIADFVIGKVIIELDGTAHNGREDYDAKRTLHLRKAGYQVIRIPNEKINKFDLDKVFKTNQSIERFKQGKAKKNKNQWMSNKSKERISKEAEKYEMVKQPNGDFKRVRIDTGRHDPVAYKSWK